MKLDLVSLLAVAAINLMALSLALPAIMGRQISKAARSAQTSVILQGLTWAAMLASEFAADQGWRLPDLLLSTLSITCAAFTQWHIFRALEGWLGPRPGRWLLLAVVVAAPVGYAAGFGHYAWRVGWSNAVLAAGGLIVARAALWPVQPAHRPWRLMLLACMACMAGLTLARGYLGAFTPDYPSFRTPHPVNLAAALATNLCAVLSVVALLTAWRAEVEQQLRTQALTDALTGLLNRRGFDLAARTLHAQALRHGGPLTALALDLDAFKPINDQFGHETGDRALQLFARLLCQQARAGDVLARLGGDEFAVLLVQEDGGAADALVQRLRTALEQQAVQELGFAVRFSAGAALLQEGDTLATLLARADAALYAAKGRCRQSEAAGPGEAAGGALLPTPAEPAWPSTQAEPTAP